MQRQFAVRPFEFGKHQKFFYAAHIVFAVYYTTTKDGYAGQVYYKNDDGTFETVKVLADANGTKGIIGMSYSQSSQPASIFGKGDGVGADFGKDCEDWYVLSGGKLSASFGGQSY